MPGPRPPLPNDSRLSPTPISKHGAEPTEQRLARRELLVTLAVTVTSGGFSKNGRLRRGLVVRRGGKESTGASPRYNLGRERLCPPRPFREPVEYFLCGAMGQRWTPHLLLAACAPSEDWRHAGCPAWTSAR